MSMIYVYFYPCFMRRSRIDYCAALGESGGENVDVSRRHYFYFEEDPMTPLRLHSQSSEESLCPFPHPAGISTCGCQPQQPH